MNQNLNSGEVLKKTIETQYLALEALNAHRQMQWHRVNLEDFQKDHPSEYEAIIRWNAATHSGHAATVFGLARLVRNLFDQINGMAQMKTCVDCSPEQPCDFHRGFFIGMNVVANEIAPNENAAFDLVADICTRCGITMVKK